MPSRDALHLYRPAIGPAARRLGVLPLEQASLPLGYPGAVKGLLHTTDDDILLLIETRHCRQQGLTNPTLWGELLA